MGPSRLALLSILLAAPALAGDRPAAVQLCFTFPDGISLYAPTPRANYRALEGEGQILDLDLRLNGQRPERVSKMGPGCLRAWLPAVQVWSLSVSFERTALGLAAQERRVNLKLQPDLWYDGGQLQVVREPWAQLSTALPGQVVAERLSEAGDQAIADHQKLPPGTYRLRYQAPPPEQGPCRIALSVTGVGTIRPDRTPERFARMVEQYRAEWLPEVARDQQLTCTPGEALEASVRIADGAFLDPLHPVLRRVKVPSEQPRYVLRIDGQARPFEDGLTVVVAAGQALALELAPSAPVATTP